MYTVKITDVGQAEDLSISYVVADFNDGKNTTEKHFTFEDFKFKTKEDVMNMLQAECDVMDGMAAAYTEVAALVGVEDVVVQLKSDIQKEKETMLTEAILEMPVVDEVTE